MTQTTALPKTTVHTKFIKGVPCTVPNRTNDVDTGSPHWYISYNNYDRALYGGHDTTALVLGQMEYFIILNGDHRKAFQEITSIFVPAKSRLHLCLDYIREHKAELNPRSSPII